MNRKSNPWVSLAAIALLAVLLVSICTGCAADKVSAAEQKSINRFTASGLDLLMCGDAWVITDNETGVQYLFIENGKGCGLTVLQPGATDAEG